ncbi:MAG: hypothetical protein Q9212_003122 [Teloschistes hypoglaucus]
MSRKDEFEIRYPEPNTDERTYKDDRSMRYPNVGNNFPPPGQVQGGYDAVAGHSRYKDAQNISSDRRRKYEKKEMSSRMFVEAMDPDQREYYKKTSKGYTPDHHGILESRAHTWADSENKQAAAREQVLTAASKLYPTTRSEQRHWHHTSQHYGDADQADSRSQEHSKFASDPSSPARDLYDRRLIRGTIPYNDPYPGQLPPKGYHSVNLGRAESFTIQEGKTTQRERKDQRRNH